MAYPSNGSHYVITATKNGQTVRLTIGNMDAYEETARTLRRQGYTVDAPSHGYVTFNTTAAALECAYMACSDHTNLDGG